MYVIYIMYVLINLKHIIQIQNEKNTGHFLKNDLYSKTHIVLGYNYVCEMINKINELQYGFYYI